jgi:hypothetical protein
MKHLTLLALALTVFLAGCYGSSCGWGQLRDGDRVCVATMRGNSGYRCVRWESRHPEDTQSPHEKRMEERARAEARRDGRPFVPSQGKHESNQEYTQRVAEEGLRSYVEGNGGTFRPSQRSGESDAHYMERAYPMTPPSPGSSMNDRRGR